jgi:hypothetical protein
MGCLWIISGIASLIPLAGVIVTNAGALAIADRACHATSFIYFGWVCIHPGRFRTSVRTFLLSRIEHRTAISVAGFLAGESSDNVQSIARKLFRAITLERVLKKDMANASPDPELIKMTTPATLGTVDAFLSHSWQDDSDLKWEQLQAWGEEFRRTHGGREPMVWIDKYCLDQENLNEGLMCLPVFLAGCNSLLVLAGRTYPRRLWCVMELFIFKIMGGAEASVDLRLVCPPLDNEERESLIAGIGDFNANSAKCTVQEDVRL